MHFKNWNFLNRSNGLFVPCIFLALWAEGWWFCLPDLEVELAGVVAPPASRGLGLIRVLLRAVILVEWVAKQLLSPVTHFGTEL